MKIVCKTHKYDIVHNLVNQYFLSFSIIAYNLSQGGITKKINLGEMFSQIMILDTCKHPGSTLYFAAHFTQCQKKHDIWQPKHHLN